MTQVTWTISVLSEVDESPIGTEFAESGKGNNEMCYITRAKTR